MATWWRSLQKEASPPSTFKSDIHMLKASPPHTEKKKEALVCFFSVKLNFYDTPSFQFY